jgi:uncharacterized protein (DUF983 family)
MNAELRALWRILRRRCPACGGRLWVYDSHRQICEGCDAKYGTGL